MALAERQTTDAVSPPRQRFMGVRWRNEAIPLLLLALLTLLGGLMRRYHLGQQGLWFDEADLVMRARQPLPDLLRNVINPGENGPLYTFGMACWIKVIGTSEVAVRLPSAIAGTLAIPALYGLGRMLRGPRLAVIAAALLTISPYAHWYAQDAKMYSLLVLLTIVATWLLLIAIRRGGAAWVAYGVVAAITLGIHATFLLALAAHAVIAIGLWRAGYGTRPTGRQARWLVALIGVAAFPLLLWGAIFAVRNGPTWQVKATPWAILQRMLIEFSVTNRSDPGIHAWGSWLYVALAALGVGLTWNAPTPDPSPAVRERGIRTVRRSISPLPFTGEGSGVGAFPPRLALLTIGAMTTVPGLLFMLLSLRRAVFEDRYLIVALPGFLLLAALGVDGLLRWKPTWPVAVAGAVAVLIVAWIPLREVNFSTVPQKEDWREAYRHLAEHARAGDGVVVYPGYLRSTYDYYAMQFPQLHSLPVVTPPSLAPGTNVSDRALNAFFTEQTRGWERAWLVESPERAPTQDPDGRILGFYADGIASVQQRPQTLFAEQQYNGVLLDCFAYNSPFGADRLPPEVVPDLHIGDTGIGLFGVSLETLDGTKNVARGAFAPLLLRWIAPNRAIPDDYTVLVRLVDATGREVARYDIPPLDGHWPTSTWRSRDDPYDPHDLRIPPDLAPGQYRILVGMASANDPTHPLPIFNRDGVRVDTNGLVVVLPITVT
ncbi:MAG: glycosyltransferase family 39 protein [Chloroflexota bacterium]|nr:glycosyltransferase family 39 protein [Chloroflexota bacterium]